MTERIKKILDAVTDKVMAYRPADKGQQAKRVERRVKRQRKKAEKGNVFGSHLYKSLTKPTPPATEEGEG